MSLTEEIRSVLIATKTEHIEVWTSSYKLRGTISESHKSEGFLILTDVIIVPLFNRNESTKEEDLLETEPDFQVKHVQFMVPSSQILGFVPINALTVLSFSKKNK